MNARFADEIAAFELRDREQPPPEGAVLFTGSSSIRRWASLDQDFQSVPVINRGFGGAEFHEVVFYANRIMFPYRPGRIVLYAGDNDLASGKSPETVFAHYRGLIDLVRSRLPDTRIACISIKLSPARLHLRSAIEETNASIQEYTHTDDRLAYIDVFASMLGPAGSPRHEFYVEDGLHLAPAAYAGWAMSARPFVEAWGH